MHARTTAALCVQIRSLMQIFDMSFSHITMRVRLEGGGEMGGVEMGGWTLTLGGGAVEPVC
jgi:hypothetical protein